MIFITFLDNAAFFISRCFLAILHALFTYSNSAFSIEVIFFTFFQASHAAILVLNLNIWREVFQVQELNIVLMLPTCVIIFNINCFTSQAKEFSACFTLLWTLFLSQTKSTGKYFVNAVDLNQVIST